MAKRFTDSEKWKDEWFDQLSIMGKLFFFYFTDNCDHAGILKCSIRRFCKEVGAEYKICDFEREFGDRVISLPNGSMFMPKFIKFQYGALAQSNKAHTGVMRSLNYNGIQTSPYLAPSLDLPSPYQGSKDKEQDKDMEKDKDIKMGGAPSPDGVVQLWNEVAGPTLGFCKSLGSGKHRDNFFAALEHLPDLESWRNLIELCLQSEFLSGNSDTKFSVSLTWLVDFDNAVKVLNGNYRNDSNIEHLFSGLKKRAEQNA